MRTAVTGLAAAACASVFMAPGTAGAAQAPQAAGGKAGSFCVVDVATQKTTCYDTHRAFVAAMGGERTAGTSAARAGAPAARAEVAEIAGAELYEHGDHGGRAIGYALSERCKDDGKWDAEVIRLSDFNGGTNFDNLTSSVRTWGNCWIELYSKSSFRGISDRYSTVPWVGTRMNDQASSFRLKAAGEVIR
ncbi:hypothetical protein ABT354_23220 [Streptomyces sp. NPDC000594]|uniref:hypothetical protein n=1 Tax=Streptomyces sp. NPDC000594 TaxID=3154261 RepID=UPI003330D7CF